jgi:hypothetical protein
MDYRDRITIEPASEAASRAAASRITVYDVLDYLAGGMSEDEILAFFPTRARGTSVRRLSPRTANAGSGSRG